MTGNRLAYNKLLNNTTEIIKKCSKCGTEKSLKAFYKDKDGKYGVKGYCKDCCKDYYKANKERISLRRKPYYKANRNKIRIQHKAYNNINREQINIRSKAYREINKHKIKFSNKLYKKANKEKIRIQSKIYYNANKKRIRLQGKVYYNANKNKIAIRAKRWRTKRYKTDITFKLNVIISSSICKSLKKNKNGRHWEDLVGYTLDDLKKHLEKLFDENMTWDNCGKWHIDHKTPISAFNFTQPEHKDFKKCWALKNLQPMWAESNLSKSNKLSKHFQPSLLL